LVDVKGTMDGLAVIQHGLDGGEAHGRGRQAWSEDHAQPGLGGDALGADDEGGAEAVDG
jgi:hypothetical protein